MDEARVTANKMDILAASHRAVALCGPFIPFYKARYIHLDYGKDQALPESGCLDGNAAFSVNSACPSPEDLGTLRRFSLSWQEK